MKPSHFQTPRSLSESTFWHGGEAFELNAVPNLAAIKEAIGAKEEIPGCRLSIGKRLEVK